VTTVRPTSFKLSAPAGVASMLAAALVLLLPGTSLASGGGAPKAQSSSNSQAVHGASAVLSLGAGYTVEGGSEPVRELQRRLLRGGYAPGPVDGLYGPLTEAAVRRYQRAHGLAVDGVVGPQTRAVMRSPSSRGPLSRRASLGDLGGPAVVGELQHRLRSLGHHPGPIDGVYGPQTQAAVERFQRAHGLAADGVVGSRTAELLQAQHPRRSEHFASSVRAHPLKGQPPEPARSGAAGRPGIGPPSVAHPAPSVAHPAPSVAHPAPSVADGAPSETTGSEPAPTFRPMYAALLAVLAIGLLLAIRWAVRRRRGKRPRPSLPSSSRPALGPGPVEDGLRSVEPAPSVAAAAGSPRQPKATLNVGVVCAALLGALVVGAAAGALFASQASPGPRAGTTADSLVKRGRPPLETSASVPPAAQVHPAATASTGSAARAREGPPRPATDEIGARAERRPIRHQSQAAPAPQLPRADGYAESTGYSPPPPTEKSRATGSSALVRKASGLDARGSRERISEDVVSGDGGVEAAQQMPRVP
jgi:peptidoglycan hydrolase-like protein with peptidoglycan-binding domain